MTLHISITTSRPFELSTCVLFFLSYTGGKWRTIFSIAYLLLLPAAPVPTTVVVQCVCITLII